MVTSVSVAHTDVIAHTDVTQLLFKEGLGLQGDFQLSSTGVWLSHLGADGGFAHAPAPPQGDPLDTL